MGGPAAGVLLHRTLSPEQIGHLKSWLGEVAEFDGGWPNDDLGKGWEFFLNWPPGVGEEIPGARCLSGIQIRSLGSNGASFGLR